MNKAQPPKSQLKLYALDKIFNFCKNLFEQSRLPNKILFSGQKGIGKSTLCYHISNFILSKNEEYPYNIKEKEINLSDINLNSFLSLLINKAYYKEDDKIKIMVYDFVESFLLKKISIIYSDLFSYFLKRINDTKNFNLDEESLFIEINSKLLNG